MPSAIVNGKSYSFQPGQTILAALHDLELEVPSACFDARLEPYGACRLCLVEVEGRPHPVAACTTALQEGMEIHTSSPQLEATRRQELRFLLGHYPKAALQEQPQQPFHAYLEEYGLTGQPSGEANPALQDFQHPYLRVDLSQCILCYRCVRICKDLQGQFVWQAFDKEHHTHLKPSGSSLLDSACVSCGACADTCPTGAIADWSVFELGSPTQWTRSTCPYCGVGCEMMVGTKEGRIVQIKPALDSPVNKGHLCVKGRYAFGFVHAPDRITQPMLRGAEGWKATDWTSAINYTASQLERIVQAYGPDSVGILGSARATNEENYLAQKFARVVIGSNNVDCCARVCHGPSAVALSRMFGTGAATSAFDDIEQAQTLMLAGTNACENHPVIGARIKQAKRKGAKLIVIDPRQTELAQWADLHLAPVPGTDIPLFHAMARVILSQNLTDLAFLEERVEGLEEFRQTVEQWTLERAAQVTGVPSELIDRAARLYASHKPSICFHGLGLTEHHQGTEQVMAMANLALLTGNIGKPGTGVNPLRGQNNVQGSAHMGCEPSLLTGSQPLEKARAPFEAVWQHSIPSRKGLNLMEMLDAAREGKLKALWLFGYDVLLSNPDAQKTLEAFAKLELIIVQDMFINKSAEAFGQVFLPACSSYEKDGTFMNSERRFQRIRQALAPLGDSKPDWQIHCAVAKAMGFARGFDFDSPEAIWNEIRQVYPGAAGISYARLEQQGIQVPCPSPDHPGTPRLHVQGFTSGPKARLEPVPYIPSQETASRTYPFLLITGRTLYAFNAATMTGRTPNAELYPTDQLEVSWPDAQALGLQEGETVRLCSPYGQATLSIHITQRVKVGELFSTFHDSSVFINQITNPHRDRLTGTPEYKRTAVRIEKISSTA